MIPWIVAGGLAMGAVIVALSASTTTASAADRPPSPAISGGLPKSFDGVWLVSAVFPVRSQAAKAVDQHIGAVVVLTPDEVSDFNGRRCSTPHFATKRVKYAAVGFKSVAGSADQLQITCASRPFVSLVLINGKTLPVCDRPKDSASPAGAVPALLLQRPEAFYLLQRKDQALSPQPIAGNKAMSPTKVAQPAPKPQKGVPAQNVAQSRKPQPVIPSVALLRSDVSGVKPGQAAKTAASKKPVSQAVPAKAVATAPKPGTAIQLASYSGLPAATAGWKALHSTYSELTTLQPLYVAANNQQTVRLFATGAGPEKLRQICGDLQSKQAYCTLSQ